MGGERTRGKSEGERGAITLLPAHFSLLSRCKGNGVKNGGKGAGRDAVNRGGDGG